MIDETGDTFDNSALDISLSQQKLGRVIALAVPQRSLDKLLVLRNDYHATNASDTQNDTNVQALLKSDVGVFGFTMKNQGLTFKHRWFDEIDRLTYWVALMLPVNHGEMTHIKFKIEQKDYGTGDGQLRLIQEELVVFKNLCH